MSAQPETAQDSSHKGRIGWGLAWVLSLVLAFILGHQMGSGQDSTTGTGVPPTPPAPTVQQTEQQAAPTQDPAVMDLLRKLPRRAADDPLAKGSVDAKVVLTEWSDYRCPYCARWATQTLPELQRYVDDGTLRIEYRDMAVLGPESVTTAIAARSAAQQGKFWEFYNVVFERLAQGGQPDHSVPALIELARTAGVPDLARFEADLADPALQDAVATDSHEAQQMGITGTPFFVVNTTVINGAQPTQEFIAAIEAHANE
ncbi:DsbA family protein [Granulicoccus sp. GXG6511]|uniref:DsbA family protein n=1 Tax=Granulicoccus sp. GXG6511 TaxID=3381351 RepID=UPI003D7C7A42